MRLSLNCLAVNGASVVEALVFNPTSPQPPPQQSAAPAGMGRLPPVPGAGSPGRAHCSQGGRGEHPRVQAPSRDRSSPAPGVRKLQAVLLLRC